MVPGRRTLGQAGGVRRLGVTLLVAVVTAACGGSSTDAAGCTEIREPPDPASVLHVTDPHSVTYRTDPPTSGPHVGVAAPRGIQPAPLPPAVQVRALEAGEMVVQYTDEVDAATVDALSSLAAERDDVVVAPADSLPAPVVATAWTWKLTCSAPADASGVTALVDRLVAFTGRTAAAPGTD